jgi:hypothetical protein
VFALPVKNHDDLRWPGIPVFERARILGTSVEMIERAYGTLLDGSGASSARLAAFEASEERLGRDSATGSTPNP